MLEQKKKKKELKNFAVEMRGQILASERRSHPSLTCKGGAQVISIVDTFPAMSDSSFCAFSFFVFHR